MKKESIQLPAKLVKDARERLDEREIELETYISMYLRAMLRAKNLLRLEDIMPFGKFAGEVVEDICRADPGYISWLVAQGGRTTFDPAVLRLLSLLMEHS